MAKLIILIWLMLNFSINAEHRELLEQLDPSQLQWLSEFSYHHQIERAQGQDTIAYTLEMKQQHVAHLLERRLAWVRPAVGADENAIVGLAVGHAGAVNIEPKPIYGLRVTDPASNGRKLQVILVGGNHPREATGCWALHGLIEFLVSEQPSAKNLRRKVDFLIYPCINPVGKLHRLSPAHAKAMTVNGNPELKAAGETNHNRVWNRDGEFSTVDQVKASIRLNFPERSDIVLDFHGIPAHHTFFFVPPRSAHSALAKALRARGFNLRLGSGETAWLSVWAQSPGGVSHHALTPEIANGPLKFQLAEGQRIAMAMNDCLNDNSLTPRHIGVMPTDSESPPKPTLCYLFDGNANMAGNSESKPEATETADSAEIS